MISLNVAIFMAFTIILMTAFVLKQKRKNNNSAMESIPPKTQLKVVLKERQKLSHDTYNFVFILPKPDQILGIPIGKHYLIHAKINGEDVSRKYTPTSTLSQKGTFEQVIKIYRPNDHPKFPEGGLMTYYLEKLPIGSELAITGPHGHLEYFGNGKVTIDRRLEGGIIQKSSFKKIFMVAGGTGITPMYQIIQQACNNLTDQTQLFLLYANKSEDDILLREELKNYTKSNKLEVYFTLDSPPKNWNQFSGFVTLDMMRECFKQLDDSVLCCSCGPPPMTNLARKLFFEMGVKEEQYFKF